VGGRDVVFDSAVAAETIQSHVAPILRGRELGDFRSVAAVVDALMIDGRPLHTAARYGVTQALLDAVAKARRVTMAQLNPVRRTVCGFALDGLSTNGSECIHHAHRRNDWPLS
jgi:methylaspartate ammonia-lyase